MIYRTLYNLSFLKCFDTTYTQSVAGVPFQNRFQPRRGLFSIIIFNFIRDPLAPLAPWDLEHIQYEKYKSSLSTAPEDTEALRRFLGTHFSSAVQGTASEENPEKRIKIISLGSRKPIVLSEDQSHWQDLYNKFFGELARAYFPSDKRWEQVYFATAYMAARPALHPQLKMLFSHVAATKYISNQERQMCLENMAEVTISLAYDVAVGTLDFGHSGPQQTERLKESLLHLADEATGHVNGFKQAVELAIIRGEQDKESLSMKYKRVVAKFLHIHPDSL